MPSFTPSNSSALAIRACLEAIACKNQQADPKGQAGSLGTKIGKLSGFGADINKLGIDLQSCIDSAFQDEGATTPPLNDLNVDTANLESEYTNVQSDVDSTQDPLATVLDGTGVTIDFDNDGLPTNITYP